MSKTCEITGLTKSQQEKWPLTYSLLTSDSKQKSSEITNSNCDELSKDVLDFVSKQEISKDLTERREGIINHLKKRFDSEFQGSKLSAFGSSKSGLGLKDGDVDLCLEFNGKKPKKVLNTIARMLRHDGMEDVTLISHARVPIVKFVDQRSKIPIDISINNSLAIYNTKLLRLYNDCDSRVRPFILAVKHWALHRGICNAAYGTFSSYAWTLIALQSLQTTCPPVVPNIQQEGKKSIKVIEGTQYDLTMCEDPKVLLKENNSQSVGELLLNFFESFALNWPWDDNVISIRSGENITRSSKKWKQDKPSIIDAVIDNNDVRLGKHSLPVEDPFDTMHDLSRVLRPEGAMEIREEFLRGFKIISEGGDWKKLTETKFPELINDTVNTDLFEDLRTITIQDAKDMLADLQSELSVLNSELEIRTNERNNATEMSKALRKNSELQREENKIANTIKPRREKIERVKKQRDEVNNNYIPVHWIENEMSKVFKRLTEDVDLMRTPSLNKEIESFSWFFELQSMHEHSKKTRELHNEFKKLLREQETALFELENVKASGNGFNLFGDFAKFDELAHKLLMEMSPMLNQKRKLKREIGRIEAWIGISGRSSGTKNRNRHKKRRNQNRYNKRKNNVNLAEVKSRAASGGSLSLSDLDALLNSGGISSISNNQENEQNKKKKKPRKKSFSPHRGKRGRSKKGM
tara:strand:+ start:5942 stop:8020 length:2079 start_codon:yes stop_codon:yes gene_type:complete